MNKSTGRTLGVFLALFGAIAYQRAGYCWEVGTHADISESAINEANHDEFLKQLRLRREEPLSLDGTRLNLVHWIRTGAIKEDDHFSEVFFRYKHHFFDGTRGFTGILYRNSGIASGMATPDWAEGNGEASINIFSYQKAQEYFFDGLTSPEEEVRERFMALTFRTLGNLSHLVEDMAQPQHTRNDGHYGGSLFERWTDSKPKPGPAGAIPSFSTMREYLTELSAFSNSNFVSAGTNFAIYQGQQVTTTGYPEPQSGQSETVPITDPMFAPLSPHILSFCSSPPACDMTFYDTNGHKRVSTLSIFDQYVRLRPTPYSHGTAGGSQYYIDRLFTINRYNVEATIPHLIPRATDYAAGLINHFFRGKMSISLPSAGVYGIVDHAKMTGTSDGFDKIKAKVRNDTPDQAMSGGELRAILKFHRNVCYTDDLTGHPPFQSATTCRKDKEEIIISAPHNVSLGSGSEQEFEFTFQDPLPINAIDIDLQVVYKGLIGQEEAVAVASTNISEPTFLAYFDSLDYVHLGNGVYTRNEINSGVPNGPSSKTLLDMVQPRSCVNESIDPPQLHSGCFKPNPLTMNITLNGSVKITMELPEPKKFGRVAFLGDANKEAAYALSGTCTAQSGPLKTVQWGLDFDSDAFYTSDLSTYRDVAGWYNGSCLWDGDMTWPAWGENDFVRLSDIDDKKPIESTITGF